MATKELEIAHALAQPYIPLTDIVCLIAGVDESTARDIIIEGYPVFEGNTLIGIKGDRQGEIVAEDKIIPVILDRAYSSAEVSAAWQTRRFEVIRSALE